jgi:hypothetical protein
MTHAHTSGPWHLGRRAGNPAIYGKDGTEIAEILQGLTPEWRENARLIAAAPEMLAHLKMLVLGISEGINIPKDGAAITAAKEAIAKAEGKA